MEQQLLAKLGVPAGEAPGTPKGHARKGSRVRTGAAALSEDAIHRSCIEWAEANETRLPALEWLTHPANGGKRPKGEAGKLKAMGMKKGVLDLLLFVPRARFGGLAIEMKSATGGLRPEQREWSDHFELIGWRVELCRSLDEFIDVIESYLTGDVCVAHQQKNRRAG